MLTTRAHDWIDDVVFVSAIETPGERSDFYTRARQGAYTRIFRGVHIATSAWTAMDVDQRYRARVRAAAACAEAGLVFSHASAACLWQLPWIGDWPTRAHVTLPESAGGRSNNMFARHTTEVPTSFEIVDGIATTTLARTVVDLARTQPFHRAVAVADAALRRTVHPLPDVPTTAVTHESLERELEGTPVRQGVVKALRVIRFSDGLADSPGESISRVSMHLARVPAPEIQVSLLGASGRNWTVDFFWPSCGLIGEFDGFVKYSKPEFLDGRSPAEVLVDEKDREDDLRAAGYGACRWRWDVAASPGRLRERLRAAGLR